MKFGSGKEGNMKHKRPSMSGVSKTSTNFGKKKNSYGCAGQFNADKLLAKYRQVRNTGNIANSFSTNEIEHRSHALVASIKDKNSRNIEKFGEKAITGSSSKMDGKESNSQYMFHSESLKSDNIGHNMSFDVNNRQRGVKKNKKKEDAAKALLNFEDMKRKILQDYVKKNSKEINNNVVQPSHQRNGASLITNYFSQKDDSITRKDLITESKMHNMKDEDLLYLSEGVNSKKKMNSKQKSNKQHFAAVYDATQNGQWNSHQPLSQKSINTNGTLSLKERPNSNKRQSPSK
jgi:hypothetical protein